MARLWRRYAQKYPETLEAAKTYGGNACKLDEVEGWKAELRNLLHGRVEEVVLKEKIEFKSPLSSSLWEAWQKMSADPEKAEIPDQRWNGGRPSRTIADLEGASLELGRYLDKGFAKRMAKADVQLRFGTGTVSKLALIVKEKGDGAIKRRIIIDLLRSGGNDQAKVPERIVLPRCADFTESVRRLWRLKETRMREDDPLDNLAFESEDEDAGVEMVGADLSDAYCHFGVASEELKNCLAPALEEDEILVFCAMGAAHGGQIGGGTGEVVAIHDHEGRGAAAVHG